MHALAFIKDKKYPMIKLKVLNIAWFRTYKNELTAEDIKEGLSEGVLDEECRYIYDEELLRSEGIYRLISNEGKILWADKSETIKHDVFNGFRVNAWGVLYFGDVTIQSASSKIPSVLQLRDNEHLRLEIRRCMDEFGSMEFGLDSGSFQTDKVNEVHISVDFSNLQITTDKYKYNFSVHKQMNEEITDDFMFEALREKQELSKLLFTNIKAHINNLEAILNEVNGHWAYEDSIYRFYHGSFKVYYIQKFTIMIYNVLKNLLPDQHLNTDFRKIIELGTGKKFTQEVNQYWYMETIPLTTAFFHARYMLEMVLKYGKELNSLPEVLPSGWACVLSLYNIR